ncbi:MAG TPA: hypothetical protein VK786_03475 [bacterium]|jgi:hypothetical protein|nr:hypothetical protein [bacterium]
MALSPKERESIVEEETLRFETRQNLHSARCSRGHGRRFGWPWLLAFFILGYAVHGLCGRACPWEGGMLSGHCMYSGGMAPQDGQAAPSTGAPDQSKP